MPIDFKSINNEIKLVKETGELSYDSPHILSDFFLRKSKEDCLRYLERKYKPYKRI